MDRFGDSFYVPSVNLKLKSDSAFSEGLMIIFILHDNSYGNVNDTGRKLKISILDDLYIPLK